MTEAEWQAGTPAATLFQPKHRLTNRKITSDLLNSGIRIQFFPQLEPILATGRDRTENQTWLADGPVVPVHHIRLHELAGADDGTCLARCSPVHRFQPRPFV